MNLAPAGLIVAVIAAPCLWDSDTLSDELRGIPDAHDLVTGRWYRHTAAYYERRVEVLGGRDDLTLEQLDNLAVAWERLGDRTRAVGAMQKKRIALEANPDPEHLYRYHANLGTFHAHDGQFDRALVELERALELNPDAHFGRERYQIELIRYVAAAQEDPRVWSAANFVTWGGGWMGGYARHAIDGSPALALKKDRSRPQPLRRFDTDDAIEAVAGMLRFGGLEGPELYRVLGDLYVSQEKLNLAWFAWKHALEKGHPASETIEKAIHRLEQRWSHRPSTGGLGTFVPPDDDDYRRHRASADAWLAAFQSAEIRALSAGSDPGHPAVLEKLLAQADKLVPRPKLDQVSYQAIAPWALLVVLLALLIFSPIFLDEYSRWRRIKRRRRSHASSTGARGRGTSTTQSHFALRGQRHAAPSQKDRYAPIPGTNRGGRFH